MLHKHTHMLVNIHCLLLLVALESCVIEARRKQQRQEQQQFISPIGSKGSSVMKETDAYKILLTLAFC